MVLGDGPLVRRALVTNVAGLTLAFASAAVLGLALNADPSTPELASRAQVAVSDLVLALAAGCAGALSYTAGGPTYLTGVMVAVAYRPWPAEYSWLKGRQAAPSRRFLLAGGNVTALTLAAILTFLWRGMRPPQLVEGRTRQRSASRGVAIFVALLLALAALIATSQRYFGG